MKEYLNKIIVWEFKHTWEQEINIDLVIEKWSHLWYISVTNFSQKENFKLIKILRKDSKIRDIKFTISKKQALDVVKQLNLTYYPSYIFKNAWNYNNIIY